MNPTKPETISDKATRLKNSHRVILLDNATAIVIGDHDTYEIRKRGNRWSCTCRWGRCRNFWRDCSHVVAARRARKDPASQMPVARLADWLCAHQTAATKGGWN